MSRSPLHPPHLLPVLLAFGSLFGCVSEPGIRVLDGEAPIHLEEHLDAARVEGSAVPRDLPAAIEWRGDRLAAEWTTVVPLDPGKVPAVATREGEALRLSLSEATRSRRNLRGGVSVSIPGWDPQDFAFIAVEARCAGCRGHLTAAFNRRTQVGEMMFEHDPFLARGETVDLVGDGSLHRYLIRADWLNGGVLPGPWDALGLMVDSPKPIAFDLVSVTLIPKEARFSFRPAGVIAEKRRLVLRRSLYTHAPARLRYRVRVPERGRLDVGLGVLRKDAPVTFRVWVEAGGASKALLAEAYAVPEDWAQRSVDLSAYAGRTVVLTLETGSRRPGSVGLWAAPTLARGPAVPPLSAADPAPARRGSPRPNVILYVIDAGGAEYSSAYGYNRRTTPNLERLAAQGALFENARSNSSWSKPSTTSFMTSLQHPVLGGYGAPADPLPEGAPTMAQLLHAAGYQTGVFTSNTWCGTMSSLERGVDVMQETIAGSNSASSTELQASFFHWRDAYPGQPYWVHFQHTDVHWPWEPVPPTAGVIMTPQARQAFAEMERKLGEATGNLGRSWALRAPRQVFDKAGIDRAAYFAGVRDAYDEALAHNDASLGRLVEELKARGEWEDTILIVTADHGDWPGLGYLGQEGGVERVPFLNPYLTRVPLVVSWPGHIAPGTRLSQAVSLLDLLPTVLELTGQLRPDHLQGQSLAPLLLGKKGWKARPVVISEFNHDDKQGFAQPGELYGEIEMIDGRWGASLHIGPKETAPEGPRLLLYDLWRDPYCRKSLHAERPDLARLYQQRLEAEFRAQLNLGKRFPRAAPGALDSEQLRTLKSLGYL